MHIPDLDFLDCTASNLVVSEAMVSATLNAPPDWPLMSLALGTVVAALDAAECQKFGPAATDLQEQMRMRSLARPAGPHDLQRLMGRRATKHRVWTVFTRKEPLPELALRLLGCEFLIAWTLQRQFRGNLAVRALRITSNPTQSDFKYVARVEAQARKLCDQLNAGLTAEVLRTNMSIETALASEAQLRDRTVRQCAGGSRQLPSILLREVADELHRDGEPMSAVLCCAFVSGLNWAASLMMPFADKTHAGCVAMIDLDAGVVRIDLKSVFHDLAKARAGCLPASTVVVRPLPEGIAHSLRLILSKNPGARCLGDLLPPGATNRTRIPGFPKSVTIAKFLGSRGVAAMEAGVDRTVAGTSLGAFALIGGARLHYFSCTDARIADGLAATYAWLGWSAPVSAEPRLEVVGSAVTPQPEVVEALDFYHRTRVEDTRVSRRTTLTDLLQFNKNYATLCAQRFAFFTLGRAARMFKYRSSDWQAGNSFGLLADKAAGPWGGATPIPIPVVLSEQLELWRGHLGALDSRLNTFGWPLHCPARDRIQRVLRNEDCLLLFWVDEKQCVHELGSADIFVGPGAELKHDGYRHFVSNKLAERGISSRLVDVASRHTVPGNTSYSISSTTSAAAIRGELAHALDQLATDRGMRPVHGLRRSGG